MSKIEAYKPYIENLLRAEPWRAEPSNVDELCSGAFDWDGSKYWCCHECGRIGSSPVPLHRPAAQPPKSKTLAALFFLTRQPSQAA